MTITSSSETTKAQQLTLYAYVIDNKHGVFISARLSEKERQNAIYAYVHEFWQNETPIERFTHEEAIEQYFHEDPFIEEWLHMEEVDIDLPSTQ